MPAGAPALDLPLPSTASPFVTAVTGASAQRSHATPPEGESTFIPITSREDPGTPRTLRLEAILYRPNPTDTFPVVIFNHGSTGMGAIPTRRSYTYAVQAQYLLSRGYAVVVPMRKGRGQSEGTYAESEEPSCDFATWAPGIASAMEDLDGIIEYLAQQPYADVSRLLLAGQSRGGFLSVAYAAKGTYRSQVKGVINFVGGWVFEGCRPNDFNRWSYGELGKLTTLPMLWLYAEGDPSYSPNAIKSYVQAFTESGGVVDFHLFRQVPENGHRLLNYPDLWQAPVDKYLDALARGQRQ